MFETLLERLRKWIGDTAVVVLLAIAFLITIVWLLYTFVLGQNQSSRDAYYTGMLAACQDISKTVGQLATAGPDEDITEPLQIFEAMKYGQLRLFESKELERAMVKFRSLLDDSSPETNVVLTVDGVRKKQAANRVGMGLAALSVAEACRQMIQPSLGDQLWGLLFRERPDTGTGVPVSGQTPGSH